MSHFEGFNTSNEHQNIDPGFEAHMPEHNPHNIDPGFTVHVPEHHKPSDYESHNIDYPTKEKLLPPLKIAGPEDNQKSAFDEVLHQANKQQAANTLLEKDASGVSLFDKVSKETPKDEAHKGSITHEDLEKALADGKLKLTDEQRAVLQRLLDNWGSNGFGDYRDPLTDADNGSSIQKSQVEATPRVEAELGPDGKTAFTPKGNWLKDPYLKLEPSGPEQQFPKLPDVPERRIIELPPTERIKFPDEGKPL